jgi:glycosyltransferase involved in cell wall biosynthesis
MNDHLANQIDHRRIEGRRIRVLAMISSMRGGGSEQQTLLLLRHLDRTRFDPHLFLLERTGDLLSRVPDDVTIASFDDQPMKKGFYFPGRIFRQQAARLRQYCQEQSIDVIYDRTFRMTLLASAAVDGLGIRRVSTIVSPPHHAVALVERRFVTIKRWRLASAYRRSHRIIAVSDQASRSAQEYYGLSSDQIETIANPVDAETLRRSALSRAISSDPSYLILVVVGRMSVEKGHADLIAAIRMLDQNWPSDLRPLCIRMIGDGPLRQQLEEASRELKRHQMIFVGIDPDPAAEIAVADALILPSHFEGMPNVVLEAMALNTAVIATRSGGTIELEREEPTIWWADPQSPTSLAAAIEQWATDPQSATQRIKAAQAMIHQYHNVETTIQRIANHLIDAAE